MRALHSVTGRSRQKVRATRTPASATPTSSQHIPGCQVRRPGREAGFHTPRPGLPVPGGVGWFHTPPRVHIQFAMGYLIPCFATTE